MRPIAADIAFVAADLAGGKTVHPAQSVLGVLVLSPAITAAGRRAQLAGVGVQAGNPAPSIGIFRQPVAPAGQAGDECPMAVGFTTPDLVLGISAA